MSVYYQTPPVSPSRVYYGSPRSPYVGSGYGGNSYFGGGYYQQPQVVPYRQYSQPLQQAAMMYVQPRSSQYYLRHYRNEDDCCDCEGCTACCCGPRAAEASWLELLL